MRTAGLLCVSVQTSHAKESDWNDPLGQTGAAVQACTAARLQGSKSRKLDVYPFQWTGRVLEDPAKFPEVEDVRQRTVAVVWVFFFQRWLTELNHLLNRETLWAWIGPTPCCPRLGHLRWFRGWVLLEHLSLLSWPPSSRCVCSSPFQGASSQSRLRSQCYNYQHLRLLSKACCLTTNAVMSHHVIKEKCSSVLLM